MRSTLRAVAAAAVVAVTLSGCVVYDPYGPYPAYPAAVYPAPVYGPPVYGSVGVSIGSGWDGGGWHHHHHW